MRTQCRGQCRIISACRAWHSVLRCVCVCTLLDRPHSRTTSHVFALCLPPSPSNLYPLHHRSPYRRSLYHRNDHTKHPNHTQIHPHYHVQHNPNHDNNIPSSPPQPHLTSHACTAAARIHNPPDGRKDLRRGHANGRRDVRLTVSRSHTLILLEYHPFSLDYIFKYQSILSVSPVVAIMVSDRPLTRTLYFSLRRERLVQVRGGQGVARTAARDRGDQRG